MDSQFVKKIVLVAQYDSFAVAGGKFVPISPQNAQYNVIQEYNKIHQLPIKLAESESFTVADAYPGYLKDAMMHFLISNFRLKRQ